MSQHAYTITDYQKLHQYVMNYQSGNKQSADKIVESFNGFIWKYVNLITKGTYNLSDYSIRKFISLYSSQLYIKKYTPNYNYKQKFRDNLENTTKKITSLFKQYSSDEIRNELICILLNMAKKYKDIKKPSFHNYVDKCFHFEAFRGLSHLISDPITRMTYNEFIDNMAEDPSAENEFINTLEEVCCQIALKNAVIPVEESNVSIFDLESLNTNWINGITCSTRFKDLTPFERNIIILYYIQNLTDTEIATQIGVCRATINRKRLKAKKKLIRIQNYDI